jgi:adhesin transport system outer membrane protein
MKTTHPSRSWFNREGKSALARFNALPCVLSATALLSIQLWSTTVQAQLLEFSRVPDVAPSAQVESAPVEPMGTQQKAKPATPSVVSTGLIAPQSVAKSRNVPAPAQKLATEREVQGVSALATQSSWQRPGRVGRVAGPSEVELRAIFYRAIQAAVERSPQVQRAQADYEASLADIDEAKGQRLPQIDLGSQAKTARFGSGSDYDSAATGGVSLNVTTPVYDWGRIRNTIKSRKYLSNAASSSIEAEVENTAYDVTSNMVELGKQRLIVDISQQFVQRMDELVKMLAGIVAVDKGRVSELTQAKARLLQAQAALDSAESQARDAEIKLRKRIGERPVMIPRSTEWNIQPANLDMLLAKVVDNPTIHMGKAQTQSAEMDAKIVRSSALPQLNWVISKNTARDVLGRPQPWETTVSVTWAAFRGGSTRASERAALQRAESSRQRTEEQRLDLEYQIRTADHDAHTLLGRADLYRDLTVESDRIRQAFFDQWYHLGKRSLLDVLIAENDHYNNRVGEVAQRFEGYKAILRQYAGAGSLTGWLATSE